MKGLQEFFLIFLQLFCMSSIIFYLNFKERNTNIKVTVFLKKPPFDIKNHPLIQKHKKMIKSWKSKSERVELD